MGSDWRGRCRGDGLTSVPSEREMPRKPSVPKARLLKIAAEARMKPELRRFALLHEAAAKVQGYADWATSFNHVRLLDRVNHCSISITTQEVRYIRDGGSEGVAEPGSHVLP